MDRWLKRVWLVNGLVLLISALAYVGIQGAVYMHRWRLRPRPMPGANLTSRADALVSQKLHPSFPRAVGTTDWTVIPLAVQDLSRPAPRADYDRADLLQMAAPPSLHSFALVTEPGIMNLLFARKDGSDPHLLLDRPAHITAAELLERQNGSWSNDPFLVYRLALRDSDGDGRLTRRDRDDLWLSDVDGRGMRAVTDSTLQVLQYRLTDDRTKLMLLVRRRPDGPPRPPADWPEGLVAYDFATAALRPMDGGLVQRAQEILWDASAPTAGAHRR